MFDAVPRNAFAQAISNNRLFYGNYLEGFDNLDNISVQATPCIILSRQTLIYQDPIEAF